MWFLLVFEEKKVRECVRKKVDFKLSELDGEHNWVWRHKTIARTRCSHQKVELSSSWTIKFCFCCCLFFLSATGCSSSATKTITSSGAIKHTTSTHKHSREDRGGTVIVSVWRKWTKNRNNPAVTLWRSSSYRRSCQNTYTHSVHKWSVCGCVGVGAKIEKCKHAEAEHRSAVVIFLSAPVPTSKQTLTRTLARWRELTTVVA